MRSKKAGGILVARDVCVYEVSQEVVVASLFLPLKNPGHDSGVGWVSSSPGGWLGLRLCWWLYGR